MSKRLKEYTDYIASDEWKAKRKEALQIHGRACKKCHRTGLVHIHHKTYERLKDEDVENDLVPLCRKCHKNVHKFCRKHNLPLFEGTNEFLRTQPEPKKVKKKKKQRRHFKKNRKDAYLPPIRAEDMPVEKQLERMRQFGRQSTQLSAKKSFSIDVKKMIEMYGIDEEAVQSVL